MTENNSARFHGEISGGISVVIPAYNAETVIGRAIDSVLDQVHPPREIIVIDDGSVDQTRSVVEAYGERVRYLHQENAGASVARNTGVQAARFDWIAFLDGDDQWLPDRLRRQAELLSRHPDLRWVTGNFYRCQCEQDHKQEVDLTELQRRMIAPGIQDGEVFESYFQAHACGAMGCMDTMLIRKELLVEAGLFLPGQKRMNDVDLWLRMAYLHPRIGYVFQPLAVYHMGVTGSILKEHREPEHIEQFLQRHFRLAGAAGISDAFRPFAAQLLGWWVGQRMREGKGSEVRYFLKTYRHLFSPASFRKQYVWSWCPALCIAYNRLKKQIQTSIRKKKVGL